MKNDSLGDFGRPRPEPIQRWEYKELGKWEAVMAHADDGWRLIGVMRDPFLFTTGVTYFMERKVRDGQG